MVILEVEVLNVEESKRGRVEKAGGDGSGEVDGGVEGVGLGRGGGVEAGLGLWRKGVGAAAAAAA